MGSLSVTFGRRVVRIDVCFPAMVAWKPPDRSRPSASHKRSPERTSGFGEQLIAPGMSATGALAAISVEHDDLVRIDAGDLLDPARGVGVLGLEPLLEDRPGMAARCERDAAR